MIFRGYPHGSMGLPWVTGSDGRKGSQRGCDGYWNWSPLYSGLFLPQWPLSKFGRHENGGFTPRNCKNMLLIITTCCFPSTFRQHHILRIWLQPYAAGVVCFFSYHDRLDEFSEFRILRASFSDLLLVPPKAAIRTDNRTMLLPSAVMTTGRNGKSYGGLSWKIHQFS